MEIWKRYGGLFLLVNPRGGKHLGSGGPEETWPKRGLLEPPPKRAF